MSSMTKTIVVSALSAIIASNAQASIIPDAQKTSSWFVDGQTAIAKQLQQKKQERAKNVIVFVGDGMGISTITAARIFAGQLAGNSGEEYALSFETFPYSGHVKTYNTNQQTPDSAGTMTAMMTGVKTKAGVINIAPDTDRASCETAQGYELKTAIELAEEKGMATGIISTARITHATPAATYAKVPERNWESDNNLPDYAVTLGCKDIAAQLVEFEVGDGIDVAMGGGRRHFIPETKTDIEGKNGKRKDGRDLTIEWQQRYQQQAAAYIENQAQFDNLDTANVNKVLALFNSSHMQYETDRVNDVAGEPSLSEMTSKAIDVLSKDDDGFFLMVESGRIDHGHHAGNAYRALEDTVEFANAVQAAMDKTNADETLIIVTADHSHVFTIAGYPQRGNDILGLVKGTDANGNPLDEPTLAKDGMPYTTVGYTNGLGYADYGQGNGGDQRYDDNAASGRYDLTTVDTSNSGFHQEALVPLSSETHAGEDISIHAQGPGAHLINGVIEQNVIFHIINQAAELSGKKYQ
ncbi:MAG: alkaline phosphatase [Kangiellaceae bacterium]|nr:alkaline phosphatase [Kangiellaceae bacterium]